LGLLLLIVRVFHGELAIAYGLVALFTLACLTEWTYVCFLSKSLKSDIIWILGIFFIGLGGAAFIEAFQSKGWMSWVIIVGASILTDTCAYVFGSWIRGPKILPRISPSKTYAGTLGALGVAPLLTLMLGWILDHSITWPDALMFSFCAQIGDFLESWAKRHLAIKDTGTWIKGHGGLMDRTDSWWLSAIGYGIGPWV
jgi:phosphatidate cytidylyltransferase